MKAVRMHGYGGVDQLYYEEADEPRVAQPDEVVVRLKAAAINHIDIWNRMGATGIALEMPHILGADGAGIIVEVGENVANVKAGDAVCLYPPSGCGRCEFCLTDRDFMCIRLRALGERLEGTYAQFVRLPAQNCFPMPAGFTFEEAAAFPLVFITLWRMLITNAKLKPGETMLIIGIGGGVASASLQVAKKVGAHVIVTSGSDEKLERARKLGADHGVNHRKQDFTRVVTQVTEGRGVDVVLDCVAGEVWQKSLAALATGGRLVTCGATAGAQPIDDLTAIFSKHLKIYGSTLGSREEFRQLLSFLNGAGIKPIVDIVFPLKEAAAAQTYLEEGRQFGKVVLRIPD
ncbi:MAG: zinc-binding dehydrogenase [Deltaproteobacteria bacterium]|nr:zinc-binding dehydrogenase [Deltaproteobacteria bacterium]MBI2367847.1 zinc-binding dehydrogenase [Deltaproteobacteria bacterium]MBI3064889.1 zinc-binding dehydrogenase [Deltaproteobacteria bacterium]